MCLVCLLPVAVIFVYTTNLPKIVSIVCFSEDRRTANVIALAPGVECLTVDRE